jgi:hypothetical protein
VTEKCPVLATSSLLKGLPYGGHVLRSAYIKRPGEFSKPTIFNLLKEGEKVGKGSVVQFFGIFCN